MEWRGLGGITQDGKVARVRTARPFWGESIILWLDFYLLLGGNLSMTSNTSTLILGSLQLVPLPYLFPPAPATVIHLLRRGPGVPEGGGPMSPTACRQVHNLCQHEGCTWTVPAPPHATPDTGLPHSGADFCSQHLKPPFRFVLVLCYTAPPEIRQKSGDLGYRTGGMMDTTL